MKFREMPYERPDLDEAKSAIAALTKKLREAPDYESARNVLLEKEKIEKHLNTLATLASVRHTIDTRDAFYDAEDTFWNNAGPELEEYSQNFLAALLESPFRKDFENEFGSVLFINAEIARKTFSPAIIADMQKENDLNQSYEKLIASAQIPFEGGTYTISQLSPFKNDPDDDRRLAAWKAEGGWYKENQPELDRIYDELVKVRDGMGRKMGYEGYTTLGYYRMTRNCYTKEDVEKFRAAVREYVVSVADAIYRRQAKRLGKTYPMSFADNAMEFRSGNPKPQG
ncbi:MAG: M3 family oligoendopeptidase, partial [Lachnospiraceae bacterium]|nr:M3 family oligoendopeptidase [Lachnospiraceae bacterium]